MTRFTRRRAMPTLFEAVEYYLREVSAFKKGAASERSISRIWLGTDLATRANPVQLVIRPSVDDARDRRLHERITLRGISSEQCPRREIDLQHGAGRAATPPA